MSTKSNDDRYKDRLSRITKRDIIAAVVPHDHTHTTMGALRNHLGIRKDDASLDERIKQVYRDHNGGANPDA